MDNTTQNQENHIKYIDWFNNYLSIECFADHNGLSDKRAYRVLLKGRAINYSNYGYIPNWSK